MPLLSTLCLTFLIGVLFARAHRDTLTQQEQPLQAPGAWLVLAFGVFFWGPAMAYLILTNLPWAVSYWFEPSHLPTAITSLAVLAYAGGPMLGYLAAAQPLMSNRNDRVVLLMGSSIGLTAISILIGLPRLLVVGTHREYQQGFGLEQLAGSSLGLTLVWSVVMFGLVVTWLAQRLRKPSATSSGQPPNRKIQL